MSQQNKVRPWRLGMRRLELRKGAWLLVRFLIALFLFTGLFFIFKKNEGVDFAHAKNCQRAQALITSLRPLAVGDMAALIFPTSSSTLPSFSFTDTSQTSRNLQDFQGKIVLLNLWASWCVPCRQEMPSLDLLQAQFAKERFEILALNIETSRLEQRDTFWHQAELHHMQMYTDTQGQAAPLLRQAGHMKGLPTSLLLDEHGCLLAEMAGPADWSSQDALHLVHALLTNQSSETEKLIQKIKD